MNYAFAGDSFHFGKTHTKRRANWRWHSGAEPIPACWEEEGGPLAMEARNSARLARDAEGLMSTMKLLSSFPRAIRERRMDSRSPWSLLGPLWRRSLMRPPLGELHALSCHHRRIGCLMPCETHMVQCLLHDLIDLSWTG